MATERRRTRMFAFNLSQAVLLQCRDTFDMTDRCGRSSGMAFFPGDRGAATKISGDGPSGVRRLVHSGLRALGGSVRDRLFEHSLQHPANRKCHRSGHHGSRCSLFQRADESPARSPIGASACRFNDLIARFHLRPRELLFLDQRSMHSGAPIIQIYQITHSGTKFDPPCAASCRPLGRGKREIEGRCRRAAKPLETP
jgi:hypothetical protein